MADLNKFEKMLELLVNEDKAAAEELFHEIVVEKSRDIYESLLEDEDEIEEESDEEVEESDEEVEESDEEADEDLDENFSLDTFEVEADDEEADDMDDEADDEEADDMGDEEGEADGDVEDRVEDLEDALDSLKAEFEKMMAGEEGEDDGEEADDDMGGDATDDMMSDLGMDTEESAEDESFQATITPMETKVVKSASEQMREYVEKVSATMGDNGANNKSAVAKPNNMGGTSANIAKSAVANDPEAGAGSTVKGSALSNTSAKDIGTGNVNVPGGKAAKAGKTVPAGHGAEKKGAGETAANTKSIIGK